MLALRQFPDLAGDYGLIEKAVQQIENSKTDGSSRPMDPPVMIGRKEDQCQAGYGSRQGEEWICHEDGVERDPLVPEWFKPAHTVIIEGIEQQVNGYLGTQEEDPFFQRDIMRPVESFSRDGKKKTDQDAE
jgi:hypothetical protein